MTREIRDGERCAKSGFTGVHAWELTIERHKRADHATGVSCKFCSIRPATDHRRLFQFAFDAEQQHRATHKTPLIDSFEASVSR